MLGRLHYIASYRGQDDPVRVLERVFVALEAGVPCVQLRGKDCPDRRRYDLARRVVELSHQAGARCIINDRVDIALAAGADGVHVGDDDLPAVEARGLLGEPSATGGPPVLGVTARTPGDGVKAERAGATYLGVGPCYVTTTKEGLPPPIGPQGVAAVAQAVGCPVLAIGGVTAEHVPELLAAGAYGIAVVTAISAATDPVAAVRHLLTCLADATGTATAAGRP
jgi:thiamine-phosphate pyrophosphorylase